MAKLRCCAYILLLAGMLAWVGDATAQVEPEPVVLTPVVSHPNTYATSRHRLSTGAYVQMTSGCSEWAGGGSGFMLWWDEVLDDWSHVLLPSGAFFETGRHLVVEAKRQVGSDGVEEPTVLPEGCRYTIHDTTGTIYCTELVAVDLRSGAIQSAGYDTFAPITAGTGRFVVVSVAGTEQTPHRHVYGRDSREMRVWDLETGSVTALGPLNERPHARSSDTEVFVRLGESPDYTYRAVDGTTGLVRDVSAEEAAIPDRSYRTRSPRRSSLAVEAPAAWVTTDGRPIVVESRYAPDGLAPPQTGGCGVEGPSWADGLLFTDHGVYRWPDDLELENR